MTPKKVVYSGPIGRRNAILIGWKLLVSSTMLLCVVAIIRTYSGNLGVVPSHLTSGRKIDPGFSSEETLKEKSVHLVKPPKVAFLFLVKRDIPLDFLWDNFFQSADVAHFSIYIHSTPGFKFDGLTTRSLFFYDRQISNSVQVAWGESTMIEAERLLLAAALEDSSNQRFVLLSDSCVPLYNFTFIYNYLMASSKSFVDSFLEKRESRYNKMMLPAIVKSKWRKGSQWIALNRQHASVVINDEIVFANFRKHCYRRQLSKLKEKPSKHRDCIPDEHYVQTLLSMKGLEDELERRSLTYTEWDQSTNENRGWHPKTFSFGNIGIEKINKIKAIKNINFEGEKRVEWCKINSDPVPCFIFARKFSRGAAMHILAEGLVNSIEDVTTSET